MISLLDDFSLLHYQNLVCLSYGRKAVGHNKTGAPLHHPVKGLLNHQLGSRINGRGSLIQNQHRRLAEHHSGNAQKLLLSLGKTASVLRNHRVVSLRHSGNEAVGMGFFRRFHNLLHGGVRPSIGNIIPDRRRFQPRLLENHSVGSPQAFSGHLPDVAAADLNPSAVRIIKTHQQIDHRTFSASGRACNGYLFPRFHREI
ncbi:putative uncharacterized protein [Clostridium sp. CAG:299]|nr:putative uncharacterized protein [Clostridium sp. CAG:299]